MEALDIKKNIPVHLDLGNLACFDVNTLDLELLKNTFDQFYSINIE